MCAANTKMVMYSWNLEFPVLYLNTLKAKTKAKIKELFKTDTLGPVL